MRPLLGLEDQRCPGPLSVVDRYAELSRSQLFGQHCRHSLTFPRATAQETGTPRCALRPSVLRRAIKRHSAAPRGRMNYDAACRRATRMLGISRARSQTTNTRQ